MNTKSTQLAISILAGLATIVSLATAAMLFLGNTKAQAAVAPVVIDVAEVKQEVRDHVRAPVGHRKTEESLDKLLQDVAWIRGTMDPNYKKK